MKLPTIKRIMREDLKDAPPWVNGLIDPLNSFMETVYQALNRNLTLTENVASFTIELTYNTDSSYPSAQPDVSFANQLRVRPTGVMVMQVYDRSNYTPPAGPVYLPWILVNNQITISTITGLAASKSYLIRMVVF